jgi:hypothetical protein
MKERVPDCSVETHRRGLGSTSSGVKIASISLSDEVATIKNTGNRDMDMNGGRL